MSLAQLVLSIQAFIVSFHQWMLCVEYVNFYMLYVCVHVCVWPEFCSVLFCTRHQNSNSLDLDQPLLRNSYDRLHRLTILRPNNYLIGKVI